MGKNNTSSKPRTAAVCGIDLGSRHSEICVLDADGAVLERGRVATTPAALERAFGERTPLPIGIETGGQSNWVRRLLSEFGHEVVVADAKRVKLITDTHSKDDRRDARWLAVILLRWPELLKPVAPRSLESERHPAQLRPALARDDVGSLRPQNRRPSSRAAARSLATHARRRRRAQPADPALRPAGRTTVPDMLSAGDQADAFDPRRGSANGFGLHPRTR